MKTHTMTILEMSIVLLRTLISSKRRFSQTIKQMNVWNNNKVSEYNYTPSCAHQYSPSLTRITIALLEETR